MKNAKNSDAYTVEAFMNKKTIPLLVATISIISIATFSLCLSNINKNGLYARADNNPYILNITRSINSSEIASGHVIYDTANGNPITFNFNSSKAVVNNAGIVDLLTDGYFYNDTIINGINGIGVTLSGGSASIDYGNDKNNLVFSSEILNTNGNNDVVFNVDFNSPSNYFRLNVNSGTSLLKSLRINYSCMSSSEKAPMTILFQGDSITDNSRSRTNLEDLGGGYASMVAKQLEETYGSIYDFTFVNRAHSGWNLIDDWNEGGVNHYQEEFYQYNPTIATILIGYNDIMDYANSGGVSDEDFESCYRELMQGLTNRGTKIVCMAPFFINESNNAYVQTEFPAKRQIVHNLAEEFNAEYIDMKPYMMQAVEDGAHKMELFGDLTHPWAAGCRIISDLVTDKISTLIDGSYVTPVDLGAYNPLVPSSDNNEDYTNKRVFLATSHGKLEYDNSVFYNSQEFASTKSVKMTNELYEPEQSNAYVKALFEFSDEGKKDLTSGTLTLDVKIDNLLPNISFRAHSGLTASGVAADLSTIYTVYLSDTSKVDELGNGWYRININLNAWATEQTNTALANAIAIDITVSKGETESSRQTYGVDGTQDSCIWMDNLRLNLNAGPVDYHAAKESFSAGVNFVKAVTAREYNKVTFEYYIEGNDYINFSILQNWGKGYGYFQLSGNTSGSPYNGVEVVSIEDGWKAVTIMLNSVIDGKILSGGRPDTVDMLFIRGDWSTANGYIDHIEFSKDSHPNKDVFVAGTDKTITTPSDSYTSLTFNYTITNEGYINLVVLNNWSNGYGYFKLTREGKGDSTTGITTTALGDGWISVTIDFATATIFGGSAPTNVDMLYIRGGWTTANGYIENVTFHK